MRPQDIIRKKREGQRLTKEEIQFFVDSVTNGKLADYQIAALLMAIFFQGMDRSETHDLTQAMLHSGEILDLSDISPYIADKHSTGGVGDKTSLIIAPLAAAIGLTVPMISGRGLGHTGGTLDKLESIPGYRVDLSLDEVRTILKQVGCAMMGQSSKIAPADKKLYALRDATSTIESIPLIVGSIMSKKLAAGLKVLVLDVKTGSGAFMRTFEMASELAKALVSTGNSCGVRTEALITDMNQPLGSAVGHAHEVQECIRLLRREEPVGARPVLDLSVELTARMALLAGVEVNIESARAKAFAALDSGQALERFRSNVVAQGGDPRVCDQPERLEDSNLREVKIESPHAGFIAAIDTSEVGNAIAAIGGGRIKIDDCIDPHVGFLSHVKLGEEVTRGDTLGLLYCRDETQIAIAKPRLTAAYSISEQPPTEVFKLIKEVISE